MLLDPVLVDLFLTLLLPEMFRLCLVVVALSSLSVSPEMPPPQRGFPSPLCLPQHASPTGIFSFTFPHHVILRPIIKVEKTLILWFGLIFLLPIFLSVALHWNTSFLWSWALLMCSWKSVLPRVCSLENESVEYLLHSDIIFCDTALRVRSLPNSLPPLTVTPQVEAEIMDRMRIGES